MSNLTLAANKWNDDINQVETTEPILGGGTGNANLATKQLAENILWLKLNMQAYKVGDVYTTSIGHANAAAVATHHGYGTWARYAEGRTLVGLSTKTTDPDDYKTIGNEFGENEHTLIVDETPAHNHDVLINSYRHGMDGSRATVAHFSDGDVSSTSTRLPDDHLTLLGNTGGDQPHNNIQPSKVVGCWLRTA